MRTMLIAMSMLISMIAFAATPTITGVTAQQRYPWTGKVDISYTVTGDIAAEAKQRGVFTSLKVVAIDEMSNTTNIATKLSGDTSLKAGAHAIVWDMSEEGLTLKSSNVVFTVSCETIPALYCVIDLSAGSSASAYPVTYLAEPPSGGFNVNAYKTTRLVLRRIEPGPIPTHDATITKPFYCGIFEVTQKQYKLVMGSTPSQQKEGDRLPVQMVTYGNIRGSTSSANWPASTTVVSSSFMGRLRARTGLDFDLPTEAQWEYACRAGTTSKYNNGGNTENDLKILGRYKGNCSDGKAGTTTYAEVGSYLPNAWGIYDMHGNIHERCLDYSGGTISGNDPVGPSSGSYRVFRGGCYGSEANECTSTASGTDYVPNETAYYVRGFRVFWTLAN